MRWTVPVAICMLLFAGSIQAKDCSPTDAEAADEAVDHLTTWQDVSENFTHYGQCDDGDIAEGNAEAVIRLLVDKWKTLPELNSLIQKNPIFGEWVLNHIDSTLDSNDLQKAADLAITQCPVSSIVLCQKIATAAKLAIEDNE